MRLSCRTAGLAVALAGAGSLPGTLARGDSFTPVRLQIQVAAVARRHAPLKITVRVSADPGALDDRTSPLRVRVKLATECGGTYQYTTGTTLLDKELSPQPTTGHAYSGAVKGAGRPSSYGPQIVCTWLEEEGDDRVFASDQSVGVDVSAACTSAAARYDAARHAARHKRHASTRARRKLATKRALARRACGPGVPL